MRWDPNQRHLPLQKLASKMMAVELVTTCYHSVEAIPSLSTSSGTASCEWCTCCKMNFRWCEPRRTKLAEDQEGKCVKQEASWWSIAVAWKGTTNYIQLHNTLYNNTYIYTYIYTHIYIYTYIYIYVSEYIYIYYYISYIWIRATMKTIHCCGHGSFIFLQRSSHIRWCVCLAHPTSQASRRSMSRPWCVCLVMGWVQWVADGSMKNAWKLHGTSGWLSLQR